MTSEAQSGAGWSAGFASRWRRSRWRLRGRRLWRLAAANFSSSLTRRIVSLNLGGLLALVVGVLWLNHFRADIIEARTQSLTTQAGIIAAAIAASADVDADAILVDPDKLLQATPDAQLNAPSYDDSIEFSINPEKIGPVLHQLVSPTQTRARIYDEDGALLLDTQTLSFRMPLPRLVERGGEAEPKSWLDTLWSALWPAPPKAPRPLRRVGGWAVNGKSLPDVSEALDGRTGSFVGGPDETIVSVAVPIRSHGRIKGALALSTIGRDIDKVIMSERLGLLRYFGVIAAVMLLLSLSLANTIAEPVRKLAEAAERVRRGIKSRQPIPDFTERTDEIGHLSRALGDMTQALYSRIDAIESFAADVAHELKNPLTSLRSALETLPLVKTAPSQARLLQVMQHDVRRLDRLISDISDASRLDAELARSESRPVDMAALTSAVVSMLDDSPRSRGVTLKMSIAELPPGQGYLVQGHDSRLAQVVTNLVDNACSFSEPGGEVRVRLSRERDSERPAFEATADRVVIVVEDDGPGIPEHALERIFERFYTDRPVEGFGQNSGLGLSISRQIVEAHLGRIWAENLPLPAGAPAPAEDDEPPTRHAAGARFVVSLPTAARS